MDPTVFVVDDDEEACASVCALVRSMGLPARAFASAEEFLADYSEDQPGCLVTDYRMVGMNGIQLQERLLEQNLTLPVIVLTAFARTPLTVQAIKNGALTMLDKPYDDDELWDAIRRGLALDRQRREARDRVAQMQRRLERLTESERLVMDQVVDGVPNKVIANRLQVSVRTVENRRHEVFQKMNAESVAELVRIVVELREAGLVPPKREWPSESDEA